MSLVDEIEESVQEDKGQQLHEAGGHGGGQQDLRTPAQIGNFVENLFSKVSGSKQGRLESILEKYLGNQPPEMPLSDQVRNLSEREAKQMLREIQEAGLMERREQPDRSQPSGGGPRVEEMAQKLRETSMAYALSLQLAELPKPVHEQFVAGLEPANNFETITEFKSYVETKRREFAQENNLQEALQESQQPGDRQPDEPGPPSRPAQDYFNEVQESILDPNSKAPGVIKRLSGYES